MVWFRPSRFSGFVAGTERLGSLSLSVAVSGAGGFTHDELLKVWKGLFYCMWMQDKPLLQVSVWGGRGSRSSSDGRRTHGHAVHPGQSFRALMLFFLVTGWRAKAFG